MNSDVQPKALKTFNIGAGSGTCTTCLFDSVLSKRRWKDDAQVNCEPSWWSHWEYICIACHNSRLEYRWITQGLQPSRNCPTKWIQSPPELDLCRSLAPQMLFVLHVCCIMCEFGSLGSIGLWLNHTWCQVLFDSRGRLQIAPFKVLTKSARVFLHFAKGDRI